MASILLNTAFRRMTADGLIYADAGETLVIGSEVSAEDAAALVASAGAVEVPEPEKAKGGK